MVLQGQTHNLHQLLRQAGVVAAALEVADQMVDRVVVRPEHQQRSGLEDQVIHLIEVRRKETMAETVMEARQIMVPEEVVVQVLREVWEHQPQEEQVALELLMTFLDRL